MTVHDAYNIARKAIAPPAEDQAPRTELCVPASTDFGSSPRAAAGAAGDSGRAPGDAGRPQADLQRFRKGGDGARRAEWGGGDKSGEKEREPFRSLEAIVNIVERSRASIVIEGRRWEGVRNYGEIIGFRNRADGDRWDVFVPGVREQLPVGEQLPLRRIYGVVLVKGGNHKLVVGLDPPYAPESRALVNADVQEFVKVRGPRSPAPARSAPTEGAIAAVGKQPPAGARGWGKVGAPPLATARHMGMMKGSDAQAPWTRRRGCCSVGAHALPPHPATPFGPLHARCLQAYSREHPSTSSSRVRYLELDSHDGWISETTPLTVVGTPGGGVGGQGGVEDSEKKGASEASLGGGKGGGMGAGSKDPEAQRRAGARDQ